MHTIKLTNKQLNSDQHDMSQTLWDLIQGIFTPTNKHNKKSQTLTHTHIMTDVQLLKHVTFVETTKWSSVTGVSENKLTISMTKNCGSSGVCCGEVWGQHKKTKALTKFHQQLKEKKLTA